MQEGLNYKQLYQDFVREQRQKTLLAKKQQAMLSGEASQDADPQVKSKAPEALGLRPMDSSINFDDNDEPEPSPKVDEVMKDESNQIKEK